LAWCAADAIIIHVRVDEHSIDSLELTLDMLDNPNSDFNVWRSRAGDIKRPQVSAVVMTMAGARSATKGVKDRASQMYVERAYEVAAKHSDLFDVDNAADAFVITDDFMSGLVVSAAHLVFRFRS
jgi:chromosome partitioning protein